MPLTCQLDGLYEVPVRRKKKERFDPTAVVMFVDPAVALGVNCETVVAPANLGGVGEQSDHLSFFG